MVVYEIPTQVYCRRYCKKFIRKQANMKSLRIAMSIEYIIKGNKLVVNFFKVKPDDSKDTAYIGEIELKEYIKTRLEELIKQA